MFRINTANQAAFVNEYGKLYEEKHKRSRFEEEQAEKKIDDLAGDLFRLVVAFIEKDDFPEWGKGLKNESVNETFLSKAKQLLL